MDKKDDEKLEIEKPSGLVQIVNQSISLLQRKAYNVLIFNAYPNIEQDIHRIELKEFKRLLSYHDFETLKKEILELMKIVVEMNYIGDRDKTIWEAYSLLPYVKAIGDSELEYSFGLLKEKLKSPEFYARINLIIQKKFKSKYTLALYEFCCDHFIRQKGFGITPWLPLEELKELLGYSGDMEFKFFKRNVLNRALKEINEKSDLKVTMKLRRKNRTVSAIQFLIYPDEKNQFLKKLFSPEQQELPIVEGSELYNRLVYEFNVNELLAKDIINRFTKNHIEQSLFYIAKRKDRIKDLGAYTYYIITNEKVKLLTPGVDEAINSVEIQDGAIIEIGNQRYTFSDGVIKTPKGVIPEGKLKRLISENKARII